MKKFAPPKKASEKQAEDVPQKYVKPVDDDGFSADEEEPEDKVVSY